jgi:hypothetical protein
MEEDMSQRIDGYFWRELLADEEWWTALLTDEAFWQELESLSRREQADAMMARYMAAIPHDPHDIQLLRAQQLDLVSSLVQQVGLKHARAVFAAKRGNEIH